MTPPHCGSLAGPICCSLHTAALQELTSALATFRKAHRARAQNSSLCGLQPAPCAEALSPPRMAKGTECARPRPRTPTPSCFSPWAPVLDMKMQVRRPLSPSSSSHSGRRSLSRAPWTQKPDSKQDIALQTLPLGYLILPLVVGLGGGEGPPSSSASKSVGHADPGPRRRLH